MTMSKVLVGTLMAAGLALGASHAAGAQWDDAPMDPPMGPGMMDPGSMHPACTDDDGHGVWPGMGMHPAHNGGMMPGCDWDDDWLDD